MKPETAEKVAAILAEVAAELEAQKVIDRMPEGQAPQTDAAMAALAAVVSKFSQPAVNVHVLDCPVGKVLVASVPPQMSSGQAQDIERKLTEFFGQNVLVLSSNIQFCRLEKVDAAEVARLLAGAKG